MKLALHRALLLASLTVLAGQALALARGGAAAELAHFATLAAAGLATLAAGYATLRPPAPMSDSTRPGMAASPADAADARLQPRFWMFITAALACWVAGQSWFIATSDFHYRSPLALTAQDFFLFLFGAPLAWALFLTVSRDRLSWLVGWFDYLQVLIVAGFLYIDFFILPGKAAASLETRLRTAIQVHFLEGLLLFAGFLLRGWMSRWPIRRLYLRMAWFLGAYTLVVALHGVFWLAANHGQVDLGFTLAFLGLTWLIVTAPDIAAAPAQATLADEKRERLAGLGWLLASLAPLAITRFYLLRHAGFLKTNLPMAVAVVASIACFLLYVARQGAVQFMLMRAQAVIRGELRQRQQMEDTLRQAQKLEAVGRLAGGVAHDFNNLLTIIQGQCELLQHELGDSPLRQRLEIALRAAASAADQVRRLLAFSRQQPLTPRRLDLNRLVADLLPLLRTAASESVNLHWTPSIEPLEIQADPAQLEQLLLNLVINARDAIDHSQGKIWLLSEPAVLAEGEARRLEIPPGQYTRLIVSDNGGGIAPEILSHVFEPFFTTKPLGQGTGLGLATVYGVVRQSGGAIEVASQVGQGARFTIYLPRLAAVAPAAAGN